MADLVKPLTPNVVSEITRLLRSRLSPTDARDIIDDFGQRANQGLNWYDRTTSGGLDERVDSVVKWVAAHPQYTVIFFQVVIDWRPDLAAAFQRLAQQ